MNSLAYLIVMNIKNRIIETFRKPGKLILYLIVIALIAFTAVMALAGGNGYAEPVDIIWLQGIVFAFILPFFIMAVQKGLKSGDAIFDMNDVNFLFVSPVRAQSILLYGIVRMVGMAFLASIAILFQSGTVRMFGVNFNGILIIFAGFIFAVILMQIVSLLIYSLTNGNPKRKRVVKIIFAVMFLPVIVVGAMQIYRAGGDVMAGLEYLLRSDVISWFPVAGWVSQGAISFITGDFAVGLLFLTVMAVSGVVLVAYVLFSNPDYYEDVLVASEIAFEKKRAISEGQMNTEMLSGKKVKAVTIGVGGIGTSTIFYKHLRESFRASVIGLWGMASILTIIGAAVFAAFFNATNAAGTGLISILSMLMWLQVFMIGTGRGLKELYFHYIYMIPEPPFAKIVWSNLELVFKVFVESLFIFAVVGAILRESPLVIVVSVFVYTLFTLLLIAVNYLSLRWTGADMSTGIIIVIYMVLVILIIIPGVIAAVIVGSMVYGWGLAAGLLVFAVWELIAALGCFALSKGILHRCDMPVVKIK